MYESVTYLRPVVAVPLPARCVRCDARVVLYDDPTLRHWSDPAGGRHRCE